MAMKRQKITSKLEPVIFFLIGLGAGETIRRIALWLHTLTWLDALFIATKLGVIGYIFYLGIKEWAVRIQAEELAARGQTVWVNPYYKFLPIFYWIIGATSAMILF